MYTIIGLIILGVFYVIVNILSFTGSASEGHILTLLTLNGSIGGGFFGAGILLNNWGVALGLMLIILAVKQYHAFVKYYPY